jgi:hypothetical protein
LVIKITAADSGAWHTGAGLITAIYWEMTMTDATLSEFSAHLNQEPVPRAEPESIDYEHEPSRRCAAAIRCKAKAISLPLKDLPHQRHVPSPVGKPSTERSPLGLQLDRLMASARSGRYSGRQKTSR